MKLGFWIALGVAVGTAIGAAIDQMAMGVAFGAAFGTALGSVFQRQAPLSRWHRHSHWLCHRRSRGDGVTSADVMKETVYESK